MGGVPSIKLTYFDIQGVAEKVRLALAVQGIEFEDNRIGFADWQTMKPKTKYGQLPEMVVDGKHTFTQSDAMLRYVARLKSKTLYPSDAEKQLAVDEVMGLIGDFTRAWTPKLYIGMRPEAYGYPEGSNKTEEGKARTQAWREGFVKDDLPRWMGYFSDLLSEDSPAFLCGAELTIADLAFLPTIGRFATDDMDFVAATTLDAYPKITAWMARVRAVPQIAKWYAPKPVEEKKEEKVEEKKEEKDDSAALFTDIEGLVVDAKASEGGTFTVAYTDGKVEDGNVLAPPVTHAGAPTVNFAQEGNAGKKYTLIMNDPDAPSRATHEFREFVHWVVSDISAEDLSSAGVANGTTVLDYLGVGAPCNSGLHRYVFLLFEQPEGATPASLAEAFQGRGGKKVIAAATAAGLGPVVAYKYYQSQWDESVDAVHAAMPWMPPAAYRSPKQIKQVEEEEKAKAAETPAAAEVPAAATETPAAAE